MGFAMAQTPPIPGLPGVRGIPGGEPEEGDPAPQNLTQMLKKPDPDALYPGGLELLNVDGYGMASLYQSVTGKRVLVPSVVKDVQFSFVQAGGLTNREVAELLEEFLLMEGYQLNPSQRNPNIVSMLGVNQPGGPATTVTPVKVLTDASQLALENGVVTYVMKFQYLKPEEALRAFTQIYGQFRPGGTIAEVKNASSLIITEKAPLIQSLLKIKQEIDVPSAQVGTAWVEIVYADVQELADQLNEMFNSQASSNQSAGVQRQQATNTPPIPGLAGNSAGSSAAGEENPPQITPDSRTNRIFLMGRPIDLVFIKELIAQWDVKSSDRNFLRRKLKYLPVYEFMPVAESAINSTLGANAAGGGASAGGNRSTAGANNRTTGTNNNNTRNNNTNNRANSGLGGGSSSGGSIGSASLNGSDRPTEPESILVGSTLLVSDNVTNSIIVQGPPHHIEMVESLLNELDVRNEQVAIEAVFARYGVVDNLSFGINLAQLLEGNGIAAQTLSGAGFISPNIINSFANIADNSALATSSFGGGLNAQGIAGDFGIFVRALESYTNFRSFARPTVFTTNNKEARISSGRQIAITTESSGASFSNVSTDFRDVGLELLVRPLVNSSEEITLEISIVRENVGSGSSVDNEDIPDFLSDQLETTVTVPNGAAVLLGGLIEDDESEADSGVPILRSIPLLGKLFKENSDAFARSELVIMIRPTIVDGQVQLNQYQEVYDYGSNISGASRKQFSAPKYEPRRNSAIDRIVPRLSNSGQGVSQTGSTTPGGAERRPMSPIQKALYDKKKRAAAGR